MSTEKLDLPSGAWAELVNPDVMRSRHIRLVTKALTSLAETARIGSRLLEFNDTAIAILVQDWSCTGSDGKVLPLPNQDMEALEDLDPRDYLVLLNHDWVNVVRDRVIDLMQQRVSADDFDDPDSPTGPSAVSGPGSRATKSLPAKTDGTGGTRRRSTSGSRTAGAGRPTK